MLWHYVEHVPCTPGARAERAFGTRFARAAPEPTRRAPGLASTAEPRHARPSSPQHAKPPLATSPTGQELAATPADSPCSVQRRPSLFRSPPGPWNSASSSTSVSASARRRHDALATEWRSPATLSAAAAEPPCHAIKGKPRASPSPQVASCRLTSAPIATNWKGAGLLQPLRSVRPPPPPGSIRRNQSFPLSVLFTRNHLILP